MISMNKNKTCKKMKTHRRIMIAALCVLGMYGNGNAQIRNEEVYEFPNLNEQNYRYHINIRY